jgi:hypothetical protein
LERNKKPDKHKESLGFSDLYASFLESSLDFPASAAKIAAPPDGCKMTDKLGISSAPSQVTLLANHLLVALLP